MIRSNLRLRHEPGKPFPTDFHSQVRKGVNKNNNFNSFKLKEELIIVYAGIQKNDDSKTYRAIWIFTVLIKGIA